MTASSEKRLQRRAHRMRLIQLLAILVLTVVAGRILGIQAPSSDKDEFKDAQLTKLRALDAPYILVGNSMLRTRIHPPYLSNKLGGDSVELVQIGGSASALWYLQFKNYVVAAKTQPKRVVFFFRNSRLTDPLYRTTGKYAKYIVEASHREEPVLDAVLSGVARDWRSDAYELIARAVPLHRYRESLDRGLDRLGGLSLAICCKDRGRSETLKIVNDLFRVDNFRKIKQNDTVSKDATAPADFQRDLGASFLPHIMELAEEHDIPLYFVRVQHRPTSKVDPALPAYMKDLSAYLETKGAGFIDLTIGATAPLEWYGKGDHIAREFKKKYTRWFRTRAREIFEDSK